MTREEALEQLRLGPGINEDVSEEYNDAVNMAIKALEQEPIIGKIEEEINSPNRGTCDYFIVDRIEEIIHKYKAESEGKE